LYDLTTDPSESENIVALHPDIVDELSKQMVSYIENGRSTPGLPQQNSTLQLNGKEWHQVENLIAQ
jgi:arylsulfatase A